MASVWSKIMAGITAFREAYLSSDMQDNIAFVDFESRRLRYDFYWALYENSAYRNLHKWSNAYKVTYGLYRYIRNIYNPAYRLGEFWKGHLMGGALDPEAGDGKQVQSALPIITENEAIRPAISNLWRWSNWGVKKDVWALWGAILGDTCVKVIDDVERQKVYLQLVNPATVKDVTFDPFGNVKGYIIEEQRQDPRTSAQKQVTYNEIATRDGDLVVYRTLLNGELYVWDGENSEWAEEYGFVPMVITQHNNVGLEWGWSELHPVLSKFREVDDLSSKLSDQIRKMVDAAWLFTGVSKQQLTPKATGAQASTNAPEPGREELPAYYGPAGATATPLVAPLDISATSAYILEIIKEIERDYPELDVTIVRAKGDVSGRALRISREPVEVKVDQRRANYDNSMVRIQQMALTVGGIRNYEGFSGFGLDSYAAGALDHTIGERPVFSKDMQDDMDFEKIFWEVGTAAKLAGIPLVVWLKRQGWTDEDLAMLTETPEYAARLAGLEQLALLGNQQQPSDETAVPGGGDENAAPSGQE